MGRPIKKIFIGERGAGSPGGDGVASVTLGGTNNSTGYTAADALTIGAPDLVGGVQAVGEVTVFADGALVEGATTFVSLAGTGVDNGAQVYTGVGTTADASGVGAEFTVTVAGGQTDYSDVTLTVTDPGSLYALAETITIDGSDIGGVSTTNDLTFDTATFVANGTIQTTVVTEEGSGYTSAPTVTAGTGTQGTLTLTAVISGGAEVIQSTAYVTGNNLTADMIAQKGDVTYRVETTEGTIECSLVAATPSAVGEMAIIATDSASGTYWVTKLYNNTVRLTPNTGGQFALGDKVGWAQDGVAVLNESVKIT